MISRRTYSCGFTAAELLFAMALGAAVIGAAAIGYATIAKNRPTTSATATIPLSSAKLTNYYNLAQTSIITAVAPNYGSAAKAEDLRERFMADIHTATAVFPLARTGVNTVRPATIPFNPITDNIVDQPQRFRELLISKGLATAATFVDRRNYDETSPNCSIFVIGYSADPASMTVTAVYDIDVDKITTPKGFYASVKRYVATPTSAATLTAYYDIFYPAYDGSLWPTTTDKFSPLWVSFERQSRQYISPAESADINRFKVAREQPFYLMWWPDPAAPTLGMYRASNTSYPSSDPRKVSNHMAGRTSYMFTVPAFPSFF